MSKITRWRQVAGLIDYALLSANTTSQMVERACKESVSLGFHAICVNPVHVDTVSAALKGSPVKVCTVIGFPLGATLTPIKIREGLLSMERGAHELDIVSNIGLLLEGRIDRFRGEVEDIVKSVREADPRVVTKIIVEMGYLTDEEKEAAAHVVADAKADFMKTSTGHGPTGATVEDVQLLRRVLPSSVGIKASGGIRNLESLLALVEAGASRIGTSTAVGIVEEAKERFG